MYYIYEIPGVKIGCTSKEDMSRPRSQSQVFRIIEQHADIHIASRREQELQKEFGYKVDPKPYHKVIQDASIGGQNSKPNLTKEQLRRGGKNSKSGLKAVETGQIYEATKAAHVKVSCPHCNKVGSISLMKRWHFSNCKGIV